MRWCCGGKRWKDRLCWYLMRYAFWCWDRLWWLLRWKEVWSTPSRRRSKLTSPERLASLDRWRSNWPKDGYGDEWSRSEVPWRKRDGRRRRRRRRSSLRCRGRASRRVGGWSFPGCRPNRRLRLRPSSSSSSSRVVRCCWVLLRVSLEGRGEDGEDGEEEVEVEPRSSRVEELKLGPFSTGCSAEHTHPGVFRLCLSGPSDTCEPGSGRGCCLDGRPLPASSPSNSSSSKRPYSRMLCVARYRGTDLT